MDKSIKELIDKVFESEFSHEIIYQSLVDMKIDNQKSIQEILSDAISEWDK